MRIAGLTMPLSRLVPGSLFVAVGITYVVYRGSSAIGGLYGDLGLTEIAQGLESELVRFFVER